MRRQSFVMVLLALALAVVVPTTGAYAEGIFKKIGKSITGIFKKDRGKAATVSGSIDEIKEGKGSKLTLKSLDGKVYVLTGRSSGNLRAKVGNFVTIEGNLREANKDRPLPTLEVRSYRDTNTGLSGQEMQTAAKPAETAAEPAPAQELAAPEPAPAPEPAAAEPATEVTESQAVDAAAAAAYEQHEQPVAEPAVAAEPAGAGELYVVQKGDTLATIAKAKLGKASRWKEIKTLNNIKDEKKVKAGMKLQIPAK